jgi:hypothetical protein
MSLCCCVTFYVTAKQHISAINGMFDGHHSQCSIKACGGASMADERLETSQFGVLQLYHAPQVGIAGFRQHRIDKTSLLMTHRGSSSVHVITLDMASEDRFNFLQGSGVKKILVRRDRTPTMLRFAPNENLTRLARTARR